MASLSNRADNRNAVSPARRSAIMNAVDSGQVSVSQACQDAGISLRTFYRWRRGNGPGRSCTPLAERLACITAVETGELNMLQACERYSISTRTYYRWLAQKDQIVALTAASNRTVEQVVGGASVKPGMSPYHSVEKDTGQQVEQIPTGKPMSTFGHARRNVPQRHESERQAGQKTREERIQEEDALLFDSDSCSNSQSTSGVTCPARINSQKRFMSGVEMQQGGKRRIIVAYGDDEFALVWYDGASTADIKRAVRRHFTLSAGAFFTLCDQNGEEVNVSPRLQSGFYRLVL